MSIVAVIFLVLLSARVLAFFLDDGFGGWVWDAIVLVSSLAWVAGLVMALFLLGLDVSISRR